MNKNKDLENKELSVENENLKRRVSFLEKENQKTYNLAAKYKYLSDYSIDWVYWINPINEVEYSTPSCFEITGYYDTDFANNPDLLLNIIHPEDKETFENHIAESHLDLSNEKYCELIVRIVTSDGLVKHIKHICRPLFDPNGAYLGRLATNRDVSSEFAYKEINIKNEQKFKLFTEKLKDIIWELDTNFTFRFVSPSCEDIIGYTAEEVIGKSIWEFVKHEYIEQVKIKAIGRIEHYRKTGEIGSALFRVEQKVKSGGYIWSEIHSNPIIDDKGNISGYIGVTRDISERMEYFHNLEESEKKYRMLAMTISDFIWEVNSDGEYTYVSPSIEKILGYTPEETIGKTPFDFVTPEDAEYVRESFLKTCEAKEEIVNFINHNISKDGRKVVLETSGSPFFDDNGNLAGFRGVDRDITERTNAIELMRKSYEQYKSVIEITNNGVWDWNLETMEVEFSDTYYTMLGYEPQEFPANYDSWKKLVHPDDLQNAENIINSHIEKQLPLFQDDFRLKTKDGQWKWIRGKGKLVGTKDDGSPVRMLGVHIDIDREKREQEENLLLLSSAIKSASNGIVITDVVGTIQFVNPAFTQLTGYTAQEAIGKNPRDVVNSGSHPSAFFEIMWKTILSGESWSGEIINRKKDGTIYTEELSITPVKNSKDEITNFVAIKQDVTQRNKILTQLNATNAELQAIYDNSPVMICVLEEDQTISYANKAVLDYLDTEVKSLFNNRACGAFGCVNAEDHPDGCGYGRNCPDCMLNMALNDTLTTGKSHTGIEHITKLCIGNTISDVVLLCSTALIKTGEKNKLLLNMLDITSRKQSEMKLQSSEKMFRDYVQSAPFGIFVLDTDGNFRGANGEITKQLLIEEPDLLQKNINEFVSKNRVADIERILLNTRETHFSFEIIMKRSNEMQFWALLSGVWLSDTKVLMFCQDISLRKQSEEEQEELMEALRESNETIEAALYQKNSLISELEQSRSELEKAIAAKDKFFSIIAHDLRGPFSGFLGLSDMLAKDLEELSVRELKKMSNAIYNSANSVYKLLDDLLQWSRTQIGSIPFQLESTDIKQLAENACFTLRESAEKKDISLTVTIPEDIHVLCDRNMITSVFRNLITNSVKFSERGGKVEIGLHVSDANSNVFFVKDYGIGINSKLLEKLFKIDENYSTQGTEKEKGSGLGLLISKEFIEKHGGEIWAESQEAVGSTFYFRLANN